MPVSGIMPKTYSRAILIVAAQIRCSSRMRSVQNYRVACDSTAVVGHSARKTSTLQISRP